MEHVAIVHASYLDLILCGEKSVEARLSLTRQPPYGKVRAGDVVWFKASGGGFGACATVSRARSWQHLDPAGVDRLRAEFDGVIRGSAAFWASKRRARFATLIWLESVRAVDTGPAYRRSAGGRAWYILSPLRSGAAPRAERGGVDLETATSGGRSSRTARRPRGAGRP